MQSRTAQRKLTVQFAYNVIRMLDSLWVDSGGWPEFALEPPSELKVNLK